MARYFENTTTFNFSWDQVACGYWKRYPNPQRFFNAKSVKIIEESIVDPKEKVLVTYTRNLGYTKVMVSFPEF
ncbi:hypothetical protein RR48_07183 [Papilio machaon]|uniref:PRELI/MSF1 domain-containing protein n=1 Tax=Papilio machaon TaxID=76193 RepID=A0A194RJT6_PAPMA|nr:hypothetical protein RR48_07183 [Papilio machaon]